MDYLEDELYRLGGWLSSKLNGRDCALTLVVVVIPRLVSSACVIRMVATAMLEEGV